MIDSLKNQPFLTSILPGHWRIRHADFDLATDKCLTYVSCIRVHRVVRTGLISLHIQSTTPGLGRTIPAPVSFSNNIQTVNALKRIGCAWFGDERLDLRPTPPPSGQISAQVSSFQQITSGKWHFHGRLAVDNVKTFSFYIQCWFFFFCSIFQSKPITHLVATLFALSGGACHYRFN